MLTDISNTGIGERYRWIHEKLKHVKNTKTYNAQVQVALNIY